jgi:hypothetical protein
MAKQASKVLNVSVAAVAMEDDAQNVTLKVDQKTDEVTALSDVGPRRVVDNYDYSLDMDGAADFASGQSDATLFGLIGVAAGGAVAFDPTGAVAAGASDPHYDSTAMVLSSYQLKAAVGKGVTFSATLQGASALARAVA